MDVTRSRVLGLLVPVAVFCCALAPVASCSGDGSSGTQERTTAQAVVPMAGSDPQSVTGR